MNKIYGIPLELVSVYMYMAMAQGNNGSALWLLSFIILAVCQPQVIPAVFPRGYSLPIAGELSGNSQ